MLRIRVLGELSIECSGRQIEPGGSWRAQSLLAWFALNPGAHPRGEVASRFWPDVLDSSARASLRNALWALRRALADEADHALVATRERVGLAGPPDVWVDATAFSEHVAAGELEEALALCRGDVLAGLDEEWAYELSRPAPGSAFRAPRAPGRAGRIRGRRCRRDRCHPQACESGSTRGGRSASIDRSPGALGRPGRRAHRVRAAAGALPGRAGDLAVRQDACGHP